MWTLYENIFLRPPTKPIFDLVKKVHKGVKALIDSMPIIHRAARMAMAITKVRCTIGTAVAAAYCMMAANSEPGERNDDKAQAKYVLEIDNALGSRHSIEEDEVLDIERKTRRVFLKRIRIPTVSLSDLFIGASVTIYSRQLTVLEAANEYTKTQLQQQALQATFVVTPQGYRAMGKILSAIEQLDSLQLVNVVMVQLESSHVPALTTHFVPLLASHQQQQQQQLQLLTKDVSLLIEVKLSSSTALEKAKTTLLQTAKLGCEWVLVGACGISRLHSPSSSSSVAASFPTTAVLDNCSLCLLRPRMVRERRVGELLEAMLSAGFEISALKTVHLTTRDADEFFHVYKGIYRQYHEVVKYMTSAPCIALEIRGDDAVRNFRELCGPHDVQVARVLRPTSLRARFGSSNLHNAVHCTDCPEDGVLEAQFIFSTIS